MGNILYIDDLDGLSQDEIVAAGKRLRVKERITNQLQAQGQQRGMTRAEYLDVVMKRAEHSIVCPTCNGEGEIFLPPPREVGCIHPSSASSCRLRLYLDVTGELAPEEFIKPELQITFQIGHVLHDFLQKALAASLQEDGDDYFSPEAKVDMGLVRGNTDGDMELDGVGGILEIKTDGPSSFPKRSSPDPKHRIQAGGLYATGLSRPFTVYLYVEKVWPHNIKEYVEPYDARVFKKWWKTKGLHVEEALQKGIHPKADATAAECAQCPYGYQDGCPQNIAKRQRQPFLVPAKSRKRRTG
jgi:hypothetical protein